jgi:hypothetical protein
MFAVIVSDGIVYIGKIEDVGFEDLLISVHQHRPEAVRACQAWEEADARMYAQNIQIVPKEYYDNDSYPGSFVVVASNPEALAS